jgi:hypothetical protein
MIPALIDQLGLQGSPISSLSTGPSLEIEVAEADFHRTLFIIGYLSVDMSIKNRSTVSHPVL